MVVIALICSLVVGVQSNTSATTFSMLNSINEQRAIRSLAPLTIDVQLEGLATNWSQTMADAGAISHSDLQTGVTENWKKLGENVGVGGSVESVAAALISSPPHLANMIDPDFQSVGIGIIKGGSSYYITEKFILLFDVAVSKPIPTPTTPKTTTPPIVPTTIVIITTTTIVPVTTTTKEPIPAVLPTPKAVSPVQKKGLLGLIRQILSDFWNLIRLR